MARVMAMAVASVRAMAVARVKEWQLLGLGPGL